MEQQELDMTEESLVTKTSPEMAESEFVVSGADAEQIRAAMNDMNLMFVERGLIRSEYVAAEKDFDERIERAISLRNSFVDIARQRLKVPDGYAFDFKKMEFVARQQGPVLAK